MTGPESAGLPPGRYRWVLEDDPVTGRHSRTRLYLAGPVDGGPDPGAGRGRRRAGPAGRVRARRDAYGDDGTGTGGRQ